MYRTIRKSIASSISTFENPEQFEWHKWLKSVATDNVEWEECHFHLERTDHWIEHFPEPSLSSFAIRIPSVTTHEQIQNYHFDKVKSGPVFFGFKRSNAVEVNFRFSKDVRKIFSQKEEEKYKLSIKKIFSKTEEEKELKHDSVLLKSIILKKEAKIKVPETKDYLASLKPIVLQFKLLNPRQLFNESEKRKIYSINFKKIKSFPKIYKVKSLMLDKSGLSVRSIKQMLFPNIKVLKSKFETISKIYIAQRNFSDIVKAKGLEVKVKFDESEKKVPAVQDANYLLKSILTPLNKRLINHTENLHKLLFEYQKEGVEFLVNRNPAFIADDLGLGKTLQSIIAMNKLFAEGKINSVLIICPDEEIGNWDESIFSENIQGWISHICKFTFQLTYNVVKGNRHERAANWKKRSQITITSYSKIIHDVEENLVDKSVLSKIDCLILDEPVHLNYNSKSKKLFNSLNPQYFWCLNNNASKQLLKDIYDQTGQNIQVQNYLRRSKSEITPQITKVLAQDYWLVMDENQKFEYEDSLKSSQEQMDFLLEAGNPLRFQANIFTILHKLSQISNFSEKKETSPKSDQLLKHLTAISESGEKVIVFSQYEKSGTKNISDIVTKAGIKSLAFQPGLSTKDMQNILNKFKSDKSITALIVGMKGTKLKYELPDVKYVIHFDQWWNPASNWLTQEIISSNDRKSWEGEINFYSYKMKNSVEEKLQRLLFDKGLLNKNILEFISTEVFANLISLEEWLDILGIKPFDSEKQKALFNEKLKAVSGMKIGGICTIVKSFLAALGYKDISQFNGKTSNEFLMYGSVQNGSKPINTAVLIIKENLVTKEKVSDFVHESENKPNAGKIFIITTGTFEDNYLPLIKPHVSLIDINLFVKYLFTFNMIK